MFNLRSKSLRLLTSIALPMTVAGSARAAGWSDDFNNGSVTDGNPLTWGQNPLGLFPGNYDASSGDYALSRPGSGNNNQLVTWVEAASFTDVYIRTQGVVLPAPTGPTGGNLVLLGRLDDASVSGYILYLDDGGTLGLQRSAGGQIANIVPAVNLGALNAATDVLLELNIVGTQLSGYAWRPGDPKPPAPQITATDATFASGHAGIAFDEDDDNTTGVYRFVTAQDTAIGVSQWRLDADGNWSIAANWTGGVPNRADAVVNFGPVITAARTVTVDSPHTVSTIHFDSPSGYTIAGSAALTFGRGAIGVTSGAQTISAPLTINGNTSFDVSTVGTLNITSQMTAASGVVLTKNGQGTLAVRNVRADGLAINAGTVQVLNNGGAEGVSVLRSLTIDPAAVLDLADNALVLDYTDPLSPLPDVRAQIISGSAGGSWVGTGITSSAAASNPALAIGYAESSVILGPDGGAFAGQTVDGTAVLVRTTLKGDVNLDGTVNFDDLARLAQNYNNTDGARLWSDGDFTYDGNVNFDDLAAMAQNYNTALPASPLPGAPAAFQADLAQAFAQVPEPSTALVTLLVCGLANQCRRRKSSALRAHKNKE